MKRKGTLIATVAAAVLVVALGGGARPASALDPAPDITLRLLDGKTLRLADLKGKPVLLNFWQSG